MTDESDDERRQRLRAEGRAAAFDLQTKARARGNEDAWFEELYVNAAGEPGLIPWEQAAPRFRLRQWLELHPGAGRTAIDVGCGLGDNAACLAAAGYAVTGFDLSATATRWAAQRFADSGIRFEQGDVFALPESWRGAFDLVHETYNLQAMPRERVGEAAREIATLVAPGGTLLVITRAREEHEEPEGPPWPLTRTELAAFDAAGLEEFQFEEFGDERSEPIRHFLVAYRRS